MSTNKQSALIYWIYAIVQSRHGRMVTIKRDPLRYLYDMHRAILLLTPSKGFGPERLRVELGKFFESVGYEFKENHWQKQRGKGKIVINMYLAGEAVNLSIREY